MNTLPQQVAVNTIEDCLNKLKELIEITHKGTEVEFYIKDSFENQFRVLMGALRSLLAELCNQLAKRAYVLEDTIVCCKQARLINNEEAESLQVLNQLVHTDSFNFLFLVKSVTENFNIIEEILNKFSTSESRKLFRNETSRFK